MNNNSYINYNKKKMDLTKLTKLELLAKCEELGFTKCKSKNKSELIQIINDNTLKSKKKQINFIIEDEEDENETNNDNDNDNDNDNKNDNVFVPNLTEIEQINTIRYIDLCCGIGGFRLALNNFQKQHPNYRFDCVLSADIKDDAIKTYNLNFNENIKKTNISSSCS